MNASTSADIVIGGAGVAGLAAAEALSRAQPDAEILLVDKLPPMSLTSANSGELYRNWWLDERMAGWIHRSIERMEALARECGNHFGMNRRGYAFVHLTKSGREQAENAAERFASFDLGRVRIDPGESYVPSPPVGIDQSPDGVDLLLDRDLIQRHFPYVSRDAQAVLHARRGGWLDARGFGLHLLALARERGVRFTLAEITNFHLDSHGVRAVEVSASGGERLIHTRCFVNALGPIFGEVADWVGLELPVQTVLHQLVVMPDPLGAVPRAAPFTILMDPVELEWSSDKRQALRAEGREDLLKPLPASLHLRPDGPLQGNRVRLGWPFNDDPEEPRWEPSLPTRFPEVVVKGAGHLVPEMQPYRGQPPAEQYQFGGYYTKTEENLPLIGPTDVEGFYLLGALSGYGLMAACAAGDLLAAWLIGDEPAGSEYFSLARYDDPRYMPTAEGPAASGEL